MEKLLRLYTIKDGNASAFPNEEHQIILTGFNYDAKRMGGAPIITATVMYPTCLDGEWNDEVFVEFNKEKYYLKQTPTSSKSNTESLYKHECEFVSERIALDNVYFIDAVVGDAEDKDKPISNSATFSFFGKIDEFARRFNAALRYSKLQTINEDGVIDGYYVEMGNLFDLNGKPYDNEEKLLSFDKVPFSTALQESYNQFGIPYYFEGKRIVFGYFQNEIKDRSFKYGHKNELLSITKTNANQKLVNRCTGVGSTENIPYYYPNKHPQGELKPLYYPANSIHTQENVVSVNDETLFAKNVLLTDTLDYASYLRTHIDGLEISYYQKKQYLEYKDNVTDRSLLVNRVINDENWFLAPLKNWTDDEKAKWSTSLFGSYTKWDDKTPIRLDQGYNDEIAFRITFDEKLFLPTPTTVAESDKLKIRLGISGDFLGFHNTTNRVYYRGGVQGYEAKDTVYEVGYSGSGDKPTAALNFHILKAWFGSNNSYDKSIYLVFKLKDIIDSIYVQPVLEVSFANPETIYTWQKGGRDVALESLGLSCNTTPSVGAKIKFEQVSYVQPMQTLMPPIYWQSNGVERYYNAENNTYKDENGYYYEFPNPYKDSKRKEHIVDFPNIKPSIENVKNSEKQTINEFINFAYDDDDNDQIDENGNYLHPYFYGKLRKLPFNLFTHLNEKGDATFSMTSGKCGACNFVIGVNSESLKNAVQIDDFGNVKKYGDGANKGNVVWSTPQDEQNDTSKNEVWVALKKDASTYGVIMPNAQNNYRPSVGDTFVLTNINFPIEYIHTAEERLKEEIIKFMYENNKEKFTFSIKFSRIYLEENPDVLAKLNENSLIQIEYNGETKTLYVSSFAYKKDANTVLPEITVELAETLSASQNVLQTAISEVKTDVLDRVQKMDIAAMVATKFISKDSEDYARQKITFNRGIALGDQSSTNGKIDELGNSELSTLVLKKYITSPQFIDGFGGIGYRVWLDELGLSHLTIDNLTVRQKMTIFDLLISKARSVNGGLWVSAANGKIANVVETGDEYEITLEDDNMFVAGDYIRCQVFSVGEQRSYWVEISSVDGGRLYVAKSEFENAAPIVGDDIMLDGSIHGDRQGAIHISAGEDGQPRIAIYNGISTKSHDGCLRTQLGNLDNIKDEKLNPRGYGLYSDNAYLKGEFILLKSGESIETMLSATEDGIRASVEQTQAETIKGKTLLYNPSFTKGLDGWLTSDDQGLNFTSGSLLLSSGGALTSTVRVSSTPIYDSVFFVTIDNGWIKQPNSMFVDKPKFDSNEQYPLFFSTNVRCRTRGNLVVRIGNKELYNGIVEPNEIFVSIDVDVDANTWNGQGDFYLSFDGEADFYGLTIYTSKTEVRHKTFFNMSDRLINFGAQQLDKDGNIAAQSQIVTTPQMNAAFSEKFNEDGSLKKTAGIVTSTELEDMDLVDNEQLQGQLSKYVKTESFAGLFAAAVEDDENGVITATLAAYVKEDELGNLVSEIDIEADQINLTGYNINVDSANFKVKEDGSIVAKNAELNGYILNMPLRITDENYMDFFNGGNMAWRTKMPILANCIIVQYTSAILNGSGYSTVLEIPSISFRNVAAKQRELDILRSFIGQTMTIYNETNDTRLYIEYVGNDPRDTLQKTLDAYSFVSFKCVVGAMKENSEDSYYKEFVHWEIVKEGKMRIADES